ncbi:head GIN domain-containing protein [Sphingomicrobium arenosum]|uniref:head GIN domain-containing protein n=1 Tax=Sphingomicrobium arenosum TaxID=2233861 RepID=UPI0022405E31|nr:head GIN domain-containing protein [Sphingomicrobium arenosum]
MLVNVLKAGLASAALFAGTAMMFNPAPASAQDGWTRVQSVVYGGGRMVTGSGNVVSDDRAVSRAVRRIVIEDASDLTLRQGAPELVVQTDDNIIDMIHSDVEGETLTIRSRGSYRTKSGVKAFLTLPDLDKAEVHGSGNIRIIDWQGERLTLQVNGSGDIDLKGRVATVEANVHGSGDVDLRQARIGRVDAEVAGSGDIRTGAPRQVSAVVHGSGDIHIDGNPERLHTRVHGTGEIHGAH